MMPNQAGKEEDYRQHQELKFIGICNYNRYV
jgi:hypothetical protein